MIKRLVAEESRLIFFMLMSNAISIFLPLFYFMFYQILFTYFLLLKAEQKEKKLSFEKIVKELKPVNMLC